MSCITADDIRTILLGTELSGNSNAAYRISFAGTMQSGFSYGIVQLDIGVNPIAQAGYTAILDNALADGVITQANYNHLLLYNGQQRPDLHPVLGATYQADRAFLNSTVFNRQAAHDLVDTYTNQYLNTDIVPEVQNFLAAMDIAWGDDSVFNYNHPDYNMAVAAITAIDNRFGNLNATTTYFQSHQPDSIQDVRDRFNVLLPNTNQNDWQLVQIGANLLADFDPRYHGVPNTISLAASLAPLDAASSDEVVERFLKSELGNCISDVNYTGSDNAAFLVSNFSIGGAFSLSGGLFLSSGGFPGSSNTSGSFSVSHGTAGDANLSSTALTAFPGAGPTHDASVVEFILTNNDPNVDGISFDLVFGSDEYPEWANTSYVDVAAIYVNDVNFSLFNNNANTPLSVTQANINAGNFINNTSNAYAIEWDGFSNLLTVRAPLHVGQNTIKIGVADTGDFVYDSGLYIANLELLTGGGTGGGVLNIINGDNGNNNLAASQLAEEINLFGGSDVVSGTPAQLNGDIITDFGGDDFLIFIGALFSANNLTVTLGSAILYIDSNNDGTKDTTLTLTGDFEGAQFNVLQSNGNTNVTVNEAPIIAPASFTVEENLVVVGAIAAADPEGDAFLFALSGGSDQALFSIDPHTGILRFLAWPDFETPEDANLDNVYNLIVSATDEFGASNAESVSVQVTDVVEVGRRIAGGNRNDKIAGTTGDDTLSGDNGDDTVSGSDGNDNVSGGNGSDVLNGGRGNDTLDGGNGKDVLDGGVGNDKLFGGNGDDNLTGGIGHDVLDGGNGSDVLAGGIGNDTLTGANGNDMFVFGADFGQDVISDLAHGDRIKFVGGVFADFLAVRATMHQVGGDTIIALDADDAITLQHVSLGNLNAGDFLFA